MSDSRSPPAQAEEARDRAPLRLSGRYVYIQFRPLSQKNVVFHLDTMTTDKRKLRVSFGTLYPSVRFLGSSLRVPLHPSAEGKWMVLAIDMNAVLALCSNPRPGADPPPPPEHEQLLGVTLCSDMVVRGVYTSQTAYTPPTLPGDMALPVPSGSAWGALYDWVWCPTGPAVDTDVYSPPRGRRDAKPETQRPRTAMRERRHFQAEEQAAHEETSEPVDASKENAVVATGTQRVAPPSTGKREPSSVPIFMAEASGDAWSAKTKKPARDGPLSRTVLGAPRAAKDETTMASAPGAATALSIRDAARRSDEPLQQPPGLALERIIGFSGGRFPNLSWALGNRVVFPSNNTMVLMDLGSPDAPAADGDGADKPALGITPTNHVLGHEGGSSFSPHHSAPITIVAVSNRRTLMVSAQGGKEATVCLWDLKNESWLCDLQAHASKMASASFSRDDTLLCTVGADQNHRVQILVWDVAKLCSSRRQGSGGVVDSVAVVAKQLSDFHIQTMKFSPYHKQVSERRGTGSWGWSKLC